MYAIPATFAALVLTTLVLPTPADRWRGALGLPAFLLGAASLPHLPGFAGPSVTVWISAALLLYAPVLLLLAAGRARDRLKPRAPVLLLVAAVSAGAFLAAWPTVQRGGVLAALLTAGALGLGVWADWLVGAAMGIGPAMRRFDERRPVARILLVLGMASLLAAVFIQAAAWQPGLLRIIQWQPIGVGIGVLCAAWAAGTRRVPLALVGTACATAFSSATLSPGVLPLLAAAALLDRAPAWLIVMLVAASSFVVAPALLDAEVVFTVLLAWLATVLLGGCASGAEEVAAPSR